MKFMMMMIPRVYQPNTPAAERAGEGFTPPADAVAKMMKYNEELTKAGALIGLGIDGIGQDIDHFRHVWVMLGLADADRRRPDA